MENEMNNTAYESNGTDRSGRPYLSVKQNGHFYYAERAGKDSVAFILRDGNYYGLLMEYKDPLQIDMVGAFGGSVDPNMTLEATVIKEVKEEAGYVVTPRQILYCGSYQSTTQSNEMVHLYGVIVLKTENPEREPENEGEAEAQVIWINDKQLKKVPCWKANMIHRNM
jgi:8-oxo-dGTP pyrophosphatase MutT (NUDIX family)